MKLTTTLAVTLSVVALASTAHAAAITGSINMGTSANAPGSGVVLGDALGNPIPSGSGTAGATRVLNWVAPIVTSTSGSFNSVANGSPVTFTTPWIFNPSTATNPLWQVGGFTFNLASSSFNFFGGTLSVIGTGILTSTAPGLDPTNGVWEFTTQGKAADGVFSWSSSTDAVAGRVPDGGSTLALLGVGFLGLGGVSRLIRRK